MNSVITDKLDIFFSQHTQQHYKKGEILISAEEAPSGVLYLQEGLVKQYAISQKGEELVVNVFKPVAFFPMSWAINEALNDYFYEALSDVSVWRAPKEDVIRFIKANPDVLFDLLSRVYKGVDGVLKRMTYLMAGDAYSRLVTELLIYAKRFGAGDNTVEITIPEKEIAAQSGMTRETVSRGIRILKEKAIIVHVQNKMRIPDIKRLEQELLSGA